MKVELPRSDSHPQVRLTFTTPAGEFSVTADDSHSSVEVNLPDGVGEDDVTVIAQFCGNNGQPDELCKGIILYEAIPKKQPVKKQPARPAPAPAPAPEPVKADSPADDKPASPADDKPADDKPADDKPADDKPASEAK